MLFKERRVHGTRRTVSAIELDEKFAQFNAEGEYVRIWHGDDGRIYEARTIRGTKVFVPFKVAA